MAGDKWEELQEKMTLALAPLKVRQSYYISGLKRFRQLLVDNFINRVDSQTYLEHTELGQQLFDFNAIKPNMVACLLDEAQLIESVSDLAKALDEKVAASGLLFPLDEQHSNYSLQQRQPFTPKAQRFMEQFACALSLYRINLAILDAYNQLLIQPELSIEQYERCLMSAMGLREQRLDCLECDQFHAEMGKIKLLKGTIDRLLDPYLDDSLLKQAEQIATAFSKSNLHRLLIQRGSLLVAAFDTFPNDAYLTWILWDSSWQSLLKTISTSLFNDVVPPSFLSLQTTPNPLQTLMAEFDVASRCVPERVIAFKRELLNNALLIVGEAEANLKSRASQLGFSLNLPPASSGYRNGDVTVYDLLFLQMQRSSWGFSMPDNSAVMCVPDQNEVIDDKLSSMSYSQ